MNQQSRGFSLLIKPAGADCNLRCQYCFYLEKCELYPGGAHRMSEKTLEQTVKTFMATPQQVYSFGWQGGEPTLMGLDFFKKAVELQKKYGAPGVRVANGLQTNVTLIDREMAEFFAEFKFLLGCSLDGPAEIHDHYRKNGAGKPSHELVMRGLKNLQDAGAEFNILVLVNQANVRRAGEVYRYLRDQGFNYHQYIPCVEFTEEGKLQDFAISGEEWGTFLVDIFKEWYPGDTRTVSIRHFDAVLQKMVNNLPVKCTMASDCRQYFVVEHNGDIYPCDFFVDPELRLGNVFDTPWEKAGAAAKYREFGLRKDRKNPRCGRCPHFDLCAGDCLKHRLYAGKPEDLSILCDGWFSFYQETREKFDSIAGEIRSEQAQQRQQMQAQYRQQAPRNVGRNEPCPCGSGKKFKNCCGKSK